MPPKIRDLVTRLERAGFKNLGGKGSHRKFRHGDGRLIILIGRPGGDAKPYQLREVEVTLGEVRRNEKA
jgi:predicted RNA binding protein YcfA (HicA-like mRNA interferase family)